MIRARVAHRQSSSAPGLVPVAAKGDRRDVPTAVLVLRSTSCWAVPPRAGGRRTWPGPSPYPRRSPTVSAMGVLAVVVPGRDRTWLQCRCSRRTGQAARQALRSVSVTAVSASSSLSRPASTSPAAVCMSVMHTVASQATGRSARKVPSSRPRAISAARRSRCRFRQSHGRASGAPPPSGTGPGRWRSITVASAATASAIRCSPIRPYPRTSPSPAVPVALN